MPTYQYQCKQCGHKLEELQSFVEDPLTLCPACKTENLIRVMGGGAGLIFKGSGFYLTDYRKEEKKPQVKQEETKKSETPAAPATPTPPSTPASGAKDKQ